MAASNDQFELTVEISQDTDTVLDLLAEKSSLSRTRLKQAMSSGAVWLRRGSQIRRLRRSSIKLKVGDQITLHYSARILDESVSKPELLSDEQDYSVWIKPRGVHSQGTRFGDHSAMTRLTEITFQNAGDSSCERTSLVVHRLDRYANGLMLLAHNKRAAAALSALFRERRITKKYTALVYGNMELARVGAQIDSEVDGKAARSQILSASPGKHCSLVEVQIDTGRKHQVRRHLSEIGHPIVGDRQYSGPEFENAALAGMDLQLSASYLEFECPINGQKKCYTLPDSYLSELKSTLRAAQDDQ